MLPAGINAVVDKGEVWILDSANYNSYTVAISKNVTIMAVPGVVGSLVATQVASAVNITSSVTVKFRNVVFVRNEVNNGPSGARTAAFAWMASPRQAFREAPSRGAEAGLRQSPRSPAPTSRWASRTA